MNAHNKTANVSLHHKYQTTANAMKGQKHNIKQPKTNHSK